MGDLIACSQDFRDIKIVVDSWILGQLDAQLLMQLYMFD
jgi:hypothetical protein